MKRTWLLLLLLNAAALLLLPLIGTADVLHDPSGREILLQLRIPRVLTAFLAGTALSVGGLIFQALFRNPLATPYTLGISGGAALGAVLWMRWAPAAVCFAAAGGPAAGFAGALGAVALVYGLARSRGGFASAALLLAGIAVNLFFNSLILLLQYFSDPGETFRMLRWLMGGLSVVGFATPAWLALFVAAGLVPAVWQTREMNLLLTGEELAAARGVNVRRTRQGLFFSASLLTGASVAFCGPIAFVGLMVPHIARGLVGCDHRRLLPAVVLTGGVFLAVCDGLARTLLAPVEMPAGLITSLLGGPFFIWLLLRTGEGEKIC